MRALRQRVSSWTVLALVAAAGGFALTPAPASAADPAPAALPETVAADALPTVQIDGVVWDQVVVGNTVYVGGEFTTARPAGAAPGVDTVPRSGLLAYDIRTGALVSSFAPVIEGGAVKDLAVSPDGTKLGVVGTFQKVNGVARYRTAVFNIPSGTLTNVSASLDAGAAAVALSDTTMYVGGYFSRMSGTARSRVGAVSLSTGAALPFEIPVDNNQVQGMVLSPDGSQLVISGNFTSVGGSSNPGYGLYRADATTGAGLPLPVNTEVRDAGSQAAILKLDSDADSFYGVGYVFGKAGNSEGTFRASWSDGALVNIEDCHGDTYDVFPASNGVVYKASHKHYCGTSGGFPQTTPWTHWHSTAWTKDTRGTNVGDIYGYPDHPGTPRPELLTFYPKTEVGTYTGQGQATWSVKGNDDYVVYGGEFPRVNGQPQQGLVRYAKKSIAPNKQGPRPTVSNVAWTASVQSFRRGQVKISYPTLWDYDDTKLTYRIWRQTSSTVIDTRTVDTTQWNVKTQSFTDKDVVPGSTLRYYVQAMDDDGNTHGTGWINVTVAETDAISGYGAAVIDDGASKYWPLNEPTGVTTVTDYAGTDTTTAGTGVSRGVDGAMPSSTETASGFDGTVNGQVGSQQAIQGPDTFSQEVWFRTTSTTGGKIAGFGSSRTGDSGSYDRHIYMDGSGRVYFGVYPGASRTLSSRTGLNDGQWHQVVATLGANGMVLYVDGRRVANRADTTYGQNYLGYWRIGGDSTWAGDKYFKGAIDDYSVFPTVLTPQQVDAHYVASGRASALPPRPVDAYGAAVHDSAPDLYWRLNETSGTAANDAVVGGATGTYRGRYTQGRAGISGTTGVNLAANVFGTGSWGQVTATGQSINPQVFSQEVWVNTRTNRGGRILGFGDNATGGNSGSYDRVLWMRDDGRVSFGAGARGVNVVTSTGALNDGKWHHLASTLSSAGMKLYVDGVLQGTNANTAAQAYNGYWRLGADTSWGGNKDLGLQGDVEEAAIYGRALTSAEVRAHVRAGGGTPGNVAPQSAFTSQVDLLTAAFDASGSSDPEGEALTYAWDFGDGSTGTGTKPSHTYAANGTYTVRLTVTDPSNAVAVTTGAVTVQGPNTNPVARISSAVKDLDVAFDASGSTDADGQVTTYTWDFGDGTEGGSGAKVDHAYATGGTYPVRLTVTDNRGGTDTTTRQVTVVAPNVAPTAAFTASSDSLVVSVDASASSDLDGSLKSYAWDFGDGSSANGRTATHTYAAGGTKTITLTVTDDRGATATTTKQLTVTRTNALPTASFTAAVQDLAVALDASGSADADGSVAAYAWDFGDGASASGPSATHTYATLGDKTVTLTVTDNDGATATATRQVTVSAANVAPAASFTTSAQDLAVAVDGSGSADTDGTVASYAWSWGDGTAGGSGRNATHTYAAAGQWTITLTVTDDRGATSTTTRQVTVTAPLVTDLARDGFDRVATGGWGSAEVGGAWALTGTASRFSVAGSAGVISSRQGTSSYADLTSVSSSDSVVTAEFSVDKLGGGQYVAVRGRKVGTNAYDARLLLNADGTAKMVLLRNGSTAIGKSVDVPFVVVPGTKYMLKMSVTGTSPTTLSAKVWPSGQQEPVDWLRTATDSTSDLQVAGSPGVFTYLPASATSPVDLSVHSFVVAAAR